MSKQANRRPSRQPARGPVSTAAATSFAAVPVRARHDGWTPARQIAFVNALAACACVDEACRLVGMSTKSYYTLRTRPDAGSFRQAVDTALDLGIHRLADAMLGRAINGVADPVFYKGEQIGERRRYDERMAMFLLRAHAPERYGHWRDDLAYQREDPDGAAQLHAIAIRGLAADASADVAGRPRPARTVVQRQRDADDPAVVAAREEQADREQRQKQDAAEAYLQEMREQGQAFATPSADPPTAKIKRLAGELPAEPPVDPAGPPPSKSATFVNFRAPGAQDDGGGDSGGNSG